MRTKRWIAVLAVASLVLTACGGDGEPAATDDTDTTDTTPMTHRRRRRRRRRR
jgi:outer membrane biogenesis lipoprotein LolB